MMELMCCRGRSLPPLPAGGGLSVPSAGSRRKGGDAPLQAVKDEPCVDIIIRVVKAELSHIDGFFGVADVFANVHWEAPDGCRWQVARTPTIWMSGRCPEWEFDCPKRRAPDDFCLRASGCRVIVEVLQESLGGLGEPRPSGSATVEVEDLLEGVLDTLRYWAQGPEIALELRCGEERCGTVTVRASLRRSDAAEAGRECCRNEEDGHRHGHRHGHHHHRLSVGHGGAVSSDCSTSLGGARRESNDASSAASSSSGSDLDESDVAPADSAGVLSELARRLRTTAARCPAGGMKSIFGLGAKEEVFLAVHGVSGSGVESFGPFVQAFAQAAMDRRGGSSAGIMLSCWRSEASWGGGEPPADGIPVDGILGVLVGEQSPRRRRGHPEAHETEVTVTFIMEDKAKSSSELVLTFATAEVAEEWAADLSALVHHVARKRLRS